MAARVMCKTCQGNGEIVTDWDRYLQPHAGDVGDEAVAECPDCDGTGSIDQAEAEPEIIEGLGQFRAGRGAYVSDWCATKEEAIAAYRKMVLSGDRLAFPFNS